MTIRFATEADKPAIVELLRASLGDTSSEKSVDCWNWKHLFNPFGASPVLLAEEDDALVGARAFMRWRWQQGEKKFSALRAVDTATHPDHQGKGIFKQLTLQLVEQCTLAGDDFIFNTPNAKSRPGYLKMGWIEAGKIFVGVNIRPSVLLRFGSRKAPDQNWDEASAAALCVSWSEACLQDGKLFTPKNAAYLHWRYVSNPVLQYNWHCGDGFFIACYAKQRSKFKELRISELLVDTDSRTAVAQVRKFISQMAAHYKTPIISYSPASASVAGGFMSTVSAIGPVMTLKKLAVHDADWANMQQLDNWNIVLGDMELF